MADGSKDAAEIIPCNRTVMGGGVKGHLWARMRERESIRLLVLSG